VGTIDFADLSATTIIKFYIYCMKKYLLLCITFFILSVTTHAQEKYSILNIKLPPEISYYDNQFSGLYIYNNRLFLMSESRLQDKREAILYTLKLEDIEHYRSDTSFALPYQKLPIIGLDILRDRMQAQNQVYEGLEAIVIQNNTVYLSVETTTPSTNCYLLKGTFNNDAVVLDTTFLLPLRKPTKLTGEHIYNAGFEAVTSFKNKLYTFFEYNYFDKGNYIYRYITALNYKEDSLPIIPALPFRITDITPTGNNHFTAINYFYKGTGDDEVYRLAPADPSNKFIKDSSGYKNYIRLIDIQISNKKITWKTLYELPIALMSYNWEGIAAYEGGYFIINDKYTPAKPYSSVLLYLDRWKR
jgi:hypothetical protein